uniref:Phosphoglycerate mutase n=1 Tax=Rhizochromulina marina TaxID=1034831 RepID=A0A7S2W864_9STRA|mmetsp:Transcript_16962/g.49429  ORF Transcript_16962/g.49429 Transcript_16962/m.49429 type:complete len:281 (+) Transcript_16962:2-844(+)
MRSTLRALVALSSLSQACSFRVLLIRHAQSQNNVIAADIAQRMAGRPAAEMRAAFEELRHFDPALSEAGEQQAGLLAEYLADKFIARDTPVYCSTMRRTILTSRPVVHLLGWKGNVREDLFEVGGSYTTRDGEEMVHPGTPPRELAQEFAEYSLSSELAALGDQGWYQADHRETKAEAVDRARRVSQWLWDLAEASGGRPAQDVDVACVLHGDLLALLLRALLEIPEESATTFLHLNTGTTLLDLDVKRQRCTLLWHNQVEHLAGHPGVVTGDEMLRVVS